MLHQQLLDPLPIPVVFVLIVAAMLALFEVGYRIGRWWQERTPEETEGPTGALVGSLLALMAFLLAVTMGMASDRFDARRALVLEETNAIGTTYLRAGYLPEPYAEDSRRLLREYVPLRFGIADRDQLLASFNRSTEIHADLWAMAEELAETTPDSDLLGLYIDTLNETIDVHTSRAAGIIYARVPETVLVLLVIGAALTMGMVGYGAGLSRRRGLIGALALIVALAAVLTLVVDLDRPREGFLQVNEQPLIDLANELGPP